MGHSVSPKRNIVGCFPVSSSVAEAANYYARLNYALDSELQDMQTFWSPAYCHPNDFPLYDGLLFNPPLSADQLKILAENRVAIQLSHLFALTITWKVLGLKIKCRLCSCCSHVKGFDYLNSNVESTSQ